MTTGVPLLNPPSFKPTRDRVIKVRSVPCPTCLAKVDFPCTKTDGGSPSGALQHPARRRMAVRADNIARGL